MTEVDESWPVELYVYDLSRGMARQLSTALTGRLIEGIWHTSIVVYGQEVFYGQGISITKPGQSHHGQPQQKFQLGTTSIDPSTFSELLDSIRDRFTAERYHLLDWNCNTFTNEVSELLTGNGIPSHITSLPADFLSTPFGQAMRPQIDAMFRPASSTHAPAAPLSGGPINGLLGQVASQAFGSNSDASAPETGLKGSVGTDGVQSLRTPADLDSMLKAAPCVAVLFTSETCPPCKVVQPHFASLSASRASGSSSTVKKRMLFGRVDSGPATSSLFSSRGVRATPTVQVFVLGEKRGEVKGADLGEVTAQVDLALFEIYPPHPHTKLKLPSVRGLPSAPTLASTAPNYRSLLAKIDGFLSSLPSTSFAEKADRQDARRILASSVIPALEHQGASGAGKGATGAAALSPVIPDWNKAHQKLAPALALPALFPLLDLFRVALLGAKATSALVPTLRSVLGSIVGDLDALGKPDAKVTLLVSLRLVGNLLAHVEAAPSLRDEAILPLLTTGLLHIDAGVRAAASIALYNSTLLGRGARVDFCVPEEDQDKVESTEFWSADQQCELLPALLESVTMSSTSDAGDGKQGSQIDTLHRLAASALNLFYLAPVSTLATLAPLLEVLDAQSVWDKATCVTSPLEEEKAKLESVRKVCEDVLSVVRVTSNNLSA